jgi:hypothetical protein
MRDLRCGPFEISDVGIMARSADGSNICLSVKFFESLCMFQMDGELIVTEIQTLRRKD